LRVEEDEMNETVGGMLDAVRAGDAAAAHGLLDLLNEQGDERFVQAKKAWGECLGAFAAEIGVMWSEHAPRIRYPDWRDAIVPTMRMMPDGYYSPPPKGSEVRHLVAAFASVLYRLGRCHQVESEKGDYARFWFGFRKENWLACLDKDEVDWSHRKPRPLPPTSLLARRKKTRELTALVKYVISSADAFLDQKAARQTA
jgi:hypothetical protein